MVMFSSAKTSDRQVKLCNCHKQLYGLLLNSWSTCGALGHLHDNHIKKVEHHYTYTKEKVHWYWILNLFMHCVNLFYNTSNQQNRIPCLALLSEVVLSAVPLLLENLPPLYNLHWQLMQISLFFSILKWTIIALSAEHCASVEDVGLSPYEHTLFRRNMYITC